MGPIRAGRLLRILLAASLTACLSAGIASAVPTGARRSHSCCPAPRSSQPSQPAKTTAGVPACCLFLAPSQVAKIAVIRALLYVALTRPSADLSQRERNFAAYPVVTDALVQFLSKAVLATRAPPRA